MKSAASKENSESRAVANHSQGGLKGIALPAPANTVASLLQRTKDIASPASPNNAPPAQLQLAIGVAYKALAAVNVFTTPQKRVSDATLTVGSIYIVHEPVGGVGKVRIFDQATGARYILADGNDASFLEISAELDTDEYARAYYNADAHEYKDYHTNTQPTFDRDHVSEGNTGDCWLLGPLAAMAQSPKWRAHLMTNFGINAHDFTVRLYDPNSIGALTALQKTVTGHLPTYKAVAPVHPNPGLPRELVYSGQQKGTPDAFDLNPDTTPIWPSIFEKAVALLMGGYQKLDDGEANVGMAILGGVRPTRVTGASLNDPAWLTLKTDQFDKEAAITMTTKKNSAFSPLTPLAADIASIGGAYRGLLEDHVYVVKSLNANDVELHNPHGGHHPTAFLSKADVRTYISWVDYLPGN
jgi:hypothetical protein